MFPIGDDDSAERTVPVVTYALIALNVLVFFLELSGGDPFIERWSVVPRRLTQNPGGDFITIFTSMFMHGGWLHLGGNMLYLWIFGDNVENATGHIRFPIFYLLTGILATLAYTWSQPNSDMPLVGASGAIAAVLGAYLVLFPGSRVFTWVIPFFFFELPAMLFLGFWFLLQLFLGSGSFVQPEQGGGVAYFAHIGGFVFGLLAIKIFSAGRPRPVRPAY